MEPSTITFKSGLAEADSAFTSASAPLYGASFRTRIAKPLALREREEAQRSVRDTTCRALNVVVASVLLILALPLMLLIALAVRLSSEGPVIYVQDRVGLDRRRRLRGERRSERRFDGTTPDRRGADRGGRIFKIFKFRTMYIGGRETPQVWASEDDPRVTPLGRFLRAYRLDELPQLFNVLRGDMNLVGPRPEQPAIFESLRTELAAYPERQTVRPGITGWAQVNHRYDRSIEDVKVKLNYDLEYLQRRSVVEDLAIMARTPGVMLFKQGSQ